MPDEGNHLDLSLAFDDENVNVRIEYVNVQNLFSSLVALGTAEMVQAVYAKIQESQSE